jgi:hypothetical protein
LIASGTGGLLVCKGPKRGSASAKDSITQYSAGRGCLRDLHFVFRDYPIRQFY